MFNQKEFLSQLEKIVNTDSGSRNPSGIRKVADILEEIMQKKGLHTKQIHLSDETGPLLVGENKKDATHYDAVLIGHMDTVYNGHSATNYPMRVEGNNIYGLGVSDMKGCVLTGLHSLDLLTKEEMDKLSICFLINPDEEIGSNYSQDHIEKYAKRSKCVLVMESSQDRNSIVAQRKGLDILKVEFHGKSCHASVPWKGNSAIIELANFVKKMETIVNFDKGMTFNPGIITGGTANNVVADYACLTFEFRFFDMDSHATMAAKVQSFVDNPTDKNIKITMTKQSFTHPMHNNEKSMWLEKLVLESGKQISQDLKSIVSGGGSDGNFTSKIGIPTIDGLGPEGTGFHNPELEVLHLDAVPLRVNLIKQVLLNLSNIK